MSFILAFLFPLLAAVANNHGCFKLSPFLGLSFLGLVCFVEACYRSLAFCLTILWMALFLVAAQMKGAPAAFMFAWLSGCVWNYWAYGPWFFLGYLPMSVLSMFLSAEANWKFMDVPEKFPEHQYPVWSLIAKATVDYHDRRFARVLMSIVKTLESWVEIFGSWAKILGSWGKTIRVRVAKLLKLRVAQLLKRLEPTRLIRAWSALAAFHREVWRQTKAAGVRGLFLGPRPEDRLVRETVERKERVEPVEVVSPPPPPPDLLKELRRHAATKSDGTPKPDSVISREWIGHVGWKEATRSLENPVSHPIVPPIRRPTPPPSPGPIPYHMLRGPKPFRRGPRPIPRPVQSDETSNDEPARLPNGDSGSLALVPAPRQPSSRPSSPPPSVPDSELPPRPTRDIVRRMPRSFELWRDSPDPTASVDFYQPERWDEVDVGNQPIPQQVLKDKEVDSITAGLECYSIDGQYFQWRVSPDTTAQPIDTTTTPDAGSQASLPVQQPLPVQEPQPVQEPVQQPLPVGVPLPAEVPLPVQEPVQHLLPVEVPLPASPVLEPVQQPLPVEVPLSAEVPLPVLEPVQQPLPVEVPLSAEVPLPVQAPVQVPLSLSLPLPVQQPVVIPGLGNYPPVNAPVAVDSTAGVVNTASGHVGESVVVAGPDTDMDAPVEEDHPMPLMDDSAAVVPYHAPGQVEESVVVAGPELDMDRPVEQDQHIPGKDDPSAVVANHSLGYVEESVVVAGPELDMDRPVEQDQHIPGKDDSSAVVANHSSDHGDTDIPDAASDAGSAIASDAEQDAFLEDSALFYYDTGPFPPPQQQSQPAPAAVQPAPSVAAATPASAGPSHSTFVGADFGFGFSGPATGPSLQLTAPIPQVQPVAQAPGAPPPIFTNLPSLANGWNSTSAGPVAPFTPLPAATSIPVVASSSAGSSSAVPPPDSPVARSPRAQDGIGQEIDPSNLDDDDMAEIFEDLGWSPLLKAAKAKEAAEKEATARAEAESEVDSEAEADESEDDDVDAPWAEGFDWNRPPPSLEEAMAGAVAEPEEEEEAEAYDSADDDVDAPWVEDEWQEPPMSFEEARAEAERNPQPQVLNPLLAYPPPPAFAREAAPEPEEPEFPWTPGPGRKPAHMWGREIRPAKSRATRSTAHPEQQRGAQVQVTMANDQEAGGQEMAITAGPSQSQASGSRAGASGSQAQASGSQSQAGGYQTQASGSSSMPIHGNQVATVFMDRVWQQRYEGYREWGDSHEVAMSKVREDLA
ncbi:hypothetical protein SLS62_000298 [Diatrype stigma]|uniref:Uncharacterized protein n=1 Tax=Diatrype stigma TaxID=117547 RepID=A0AAN9UYG8_9PEZI